MTNIIGSIATSVLAAAAFIIALVYAYMAKDQPNLQLLIGAVVSNFSVVVSFWLGSSAGSQKKDAVIAANLPVVEEKPRNVGVV